MGNRKILTYFLFLFLLATLILILFSIQRSPSESQLADFKATGRGMVYSLFNKNNEKTLALECGESQRESRDKLLMKEIRATIFKGGRRNKDIHIYGKRGYVANNMHNFSIQGDGQVFGKDFYLKSDGFFLKDRDILTSDAAVDFKIETLSGHAAGGMKVSLNRNYMLLYGVNGVFQRGDNSFHFHCQTLRFRDDNRAVSLEKNGSVEGKGAVLKARRIRMVFSEEYHHMQEATGSGQANFFWEREVGDKTEFWEIKARRIRNIYDPSGNLKETRVGQNARVQLKDGKNFLSISSNKIEVDFDPQTSRISRVNCPVPSTITNKGATNFKIKGTKATITYDRSGKIDNCHTRKGTTFQLNEYSGSTNSIHYDLKKESADLKGKDTLVRYKGYQFKSYLFHVDVKQRIITSGQRVKSVILLEKQNDLFSKDPIFIDANGLTIREKSQSFKFQGEVGLIQKDVSLTADWFEIRDNNLMIANGHVHLQFKNNEKEMSVKGDSLVFQADKKDIEIKGSGILKNGDDLLKADWILIQFNEKSEVTLVSGNKNVIFRSGDYSGKSQEIFWQLDKELVVFKQSAQITKKQGGEARGEDLRLDLKTKKITVIAGERQRAETIIK